MVVSGGSWMAALHGTGRKRDDPQKHQVTQPWNQSPQPPRSAVARVPWEAAAGGGGWQSQGALLTPCAILLRPSWTSRRGLLRLGLPSVPRTVEKFLQGNGCGGLMTANPLELDTWASKSYICPFSVGCDLGQNF